MMKTNFFKKCFIVTLSLVVVSSGCFPTFLTSPITKVQAEGKNSMTEQQGMNVTYHTEAEIRYYLKKSGATEKNPVTFKEKPSVASPYKAGSLSEDTLNSAINMLNQIRYIAGISSDVTLNNDYIAKTQAASLINHVNNVLSHYPSKPSGMEETLYQLGVKGASSSNIAAGYSTINDSLVNGYMEDGDNSNIDRLGHRRWILNPAMSATGFGFCGRYSAMYALDRKNVSASEYGVAWPAQTMPTDYFGADYPWSISMGNEVNKENVKVTLMRLRDRKTWIFSSASSDGYFNVNNDGYGQSGCIIFRPDDVDSYLDGDQYQVMITGLDSPVSYQVSFFNLVPVTSIQIKNNDTKLKRGSTIYLETKVTPANASNKGVKWTSSDKSVADVSNYGSVEGVGYGKATITATSLSNGSKATYTVTVIPDDVYINNISSNKSNQLTISYSKGKSVSGYEIVAATNEKFTKNKKTKIINKATMTKVTLTGLKNKQTYYVKVRAFYVNKGKKIYGDYSFSNRIWVW